MLSRDDKGVLVVRERGGEVRTVDASARRASAVVTMGVWVFGKSVWEPMVLCVERMEARVRLR
jgi:hypothetical protein